MRVRSGLGLLETTIAIAVIVTGLFAAFTLVFANRRASEEASLRFAATQLAREGVEVVRAIRDSNWLAERTWDDGIAGAQKDYTGVLTFDAATGAWTVAYQANDLASPLARVVRRSGASFVTQGAGSDAAVTTTLYRRLVTLSPVCADGATTPSGGACDPETNPPGPKVGILVRSTVQWTSKAKTHEVVAEERLYDWR